MIQLTPQLGGTVMAVMADDTDFVKAGQPLVRLDPADAKVALDQAEAALKRTITVPYAEQFGLTVPQWHLLSLLAHSERLPFAELVLRSTSDKALVSRTLRLLEKRGLVEIQAEGNTPRKRLICFITPEGMALHDKVIPLARRSQAEAIRVMTPEERRVVFHALKRVQQSCVGKALAGGEQAEAWRSAD